MMLTSRPNGWMAIVLCMLLVSQGCTRNPATSPLPNLTTDPLNSTSAVTSTSDSVNSVTLSPSQASLSTEPAEEPAQQLDLAKMRVDEWASTSPDGKWVAVGLVAFPEENIGGQSAYVRLIIFSADGTIRWTIIEEWQEIGLGFPFPAPLKWSRDGEHFYFTDRVIPDGCNVFAYLTHLYQVNLKTGSVEDLLPTTAVALAISPDDSKVAYSYFYGQPQMGLAVRDLVTGEERETTIDPGKEFNTGNIVWAPDGRALALTLAILPCAGDHRASKTVWAESTTILLLDTATLQPKILLREDPRLFITLEWNEPNKIVITDGEENSLWHLDTDTFEITRP